MNAFLYGVLLQWKLDIRGKSLLITCYIVPLLFFAIMGGIFRSLNPESQYTLIPSMTVMGVSMGALIGLPPSLSELYGSEIKKIYKANGVPLYLGLVTTALSAWIHLMLMSVILYVAAPLAFDAIIPKNPPLYFGSLAVFIVVSIGVGSILGLWIKNQAKLTMISQLFFLPSILLSGIMISEDLLPAILQAAGKIFPATWGYQLLYSNRFFFQAIFPLFLILIVTAILCGIRLKKLEKE